MQFACFGKIGVKSEIFSLKLLFSIIQSLTPMRIYPFFSFCALVLCSLACQQKDSSEESLRQPSSIQHTASKDSVPPKKAPIVNLIDTLCPSYKVIYVQESATSEPEIGPKLAEIFNKKMPEVISKMKLEMAGPPIAWYRPGKKAHSFSFDAGWPVNKKPAQLPNKFLFRTTGTDSAIIAHYYGPYELTYFAYDAMKDRLKSMNRTSSAPAFEIYVDDPMDEHGNPKDPFKVRTDIVLPYK